MSNKAKKSGGSPNEAPSPARFTSGQVMRQVGLILLVVVVWAGLLAAVLSCTSSPESDVAAPAPTTVSSPTAGQPASPAPTEAAAGPTEPAATVLPTSAPTTEPVATEAPPTPVATDLPAATDAPPAPTEAPATVPASAAVSFAADVLPLMETRCARCHGGDRTEAGLNLLSYEMIMAGSENGPVVVPGDSAASELVKLIVSGEMPRRSPRLPEAEIDVVRVWVDAGAPDN